MSKITLTPLVNLQNETTAVSAINANDAVIVTAFDNTLSRDGTSPNTMSAVIDMNSNQIINLPAPSSINSPARLIDVVSNPTIVVPGTGTSGHVVPFLDGNNSWSGTNNHFSLETFNGNATFNGPSTAVSNLTVSSTLTVPNNSINNAELAVMAANTAKGSIAGGTPADLTKTQLTTLINPVTSALSGAAPASGGGTSNFLRADATWAQPSASAITLLETLTASGTATLASTVSWAPYSTIEIIWCNLIASTATLLGMQYHAGGAYQSSNYITTSVSNTSGLATWGTGSSPTTYIPIGGPIVANTALAGNSGRLTIQNVGSSTMYKFTNGSSSTFIATSYVMPFEGLWTNITLIDGMQFMLSAAGNLNTGTIRIYGIT